MNTEVYALYRQPYFDTKQQTYRNAITIDTKPQGPLRAIVRQIKNSLFAQPGVTLTVNLNVLGHSYP